MSYAMIEAQWPAEVKALRPSTFPRRKQACFVCTQTPRQISKAIFLLVLHIIKSSLVYVEQFDKVIYCTKNRKKN